MNHHETHCCLSLLLLPSIGTALAGRILRQTGSPQAALTLSDHQLLALGVRDTALRSFHRLRGKPDPALERMVDDLHAHAVAVVAVHEPSYPSRLLEIACPPVAIFVKGQAATLLA